jgi:hypothetical protein
MEPTQIACPKLIFNDDGSNFLYSWDDLGAEDLRTYLSRLQGTQVDMVAYCVAFGGYVAYYGTEVAERLGTGFALTTEVKQRRAAHNLTRLQEEAGGYLDLVFSTLQEMGIPAVASIRMNDAHMSSDPVGAVAGRFWMNHPEWRLGEPCGYYASCLDYAVPAVREYLRRLVLEVLDKFPDIAGIELDGMRSPFFFQQGTGREQAPIMTDFLRRVRADLDATASRRGRERYLLRVNVPRSPELALETGLDVPAWDAEGLVDGISPGSYNTDFQLPIEQWKRLLSDRVPVHAYVNCSPATAQYLSLEDYRGVAANAYGAGADGIYLFNFPCLDELAFLQPRPLEGPPFPAPEFRAQCWHPDLTRSHQALGELGDPAQLAHADKRFLFYMEPASYPHYAPEQASIERLDPQAAEVVWRCYEDFGSAREMELELKLVGVTICDRFEFRVNGELVEESRLRRLHSANGRDARLHSVRLEPYSQYTIALDPAALRRGDNRLTVSLVEGEPDLLGTIEVREVALSVRYGSES